MKKQLKRIARALERIADALEHEEDTVVMGFQGPEPEEEEYYECTGETRTRGTSAVGSAFSSR